MSNKQSLGVTFIPKSGQSVTGVYEADNGVEVFETDTPYLMTDGKSLVSPLPVIDVGGPVFADGMGNAQSSMPVTGLTPNWAPEGAMFAGQPIAGAERYWRAGAPATDRNSPAYALNNAGVWVPFAADVSRITDRGLWVPEPARTNHIPDNAGLGGTGWSSQRLTFADQGDDVWRANVEELHNNCYFRWSNVSVVDETNTRSIFVKSDGVTTVELTSYSFNPASEPWQRVVLTFATGVVSASGGIAAPTKYGAIAYPDGWYRIWFAQDVIEAGYTYQTMFNIRLGNDSINSGLLFKFPQIEVGSAPTSPIRTTGSAATRPAEIVTIPNVPAGAYDLHLLLDDESEEVIPGWTPADPLPLDLPQGRYIVEYWGTPT